MTSPKRTVVRRNKTTPASRSVTIRRSTSNKRGSRAKHGKNWHPEAALLSTMIHTGSYHKVLEAGVMADWFHAYPDEWEYMNRQLIRHKATPSKLAWRRKFPEFDLLPEEDIDYLIEEVRQSHTRHTMLVVIREATEGVREKVEPTEVLSQVEKRVMKLHQQVSSGAHSTSSMTEDWEATYAEVSARVARTSAGGMSGVTTGFPTLDQLTGGIDLGHYWVVGARLKGGKTWGLGRMVTAAAMAGHDCLYYSLEMPRRQMEMRLHNFLSAEFGREVYRSLDLMQGRNFDLLGYKRFLKKMSIEMKGRIHINDSAGTKVTPMSIAASVEQYNDGASRPRLVFIDYLTLMASNDWQAIADLSLAVKSLATDYGDTTSFVAAAQVNRQGAGKEPPSADDLAGSDGIGRDLDALVTLASHSARVKRWKLAAYRHGPDGQKWWTALDLNMGTFKEITGNRAKDMIAEDADRADQLTDEEDDE